VDAGASQHVGRDADFAPCLVLDPFALAILGGNDDKSLFESLDVNLVGVLGGGKPAVEVTTLLDEMSPLQGVGGGNLGVDLAASRGEGLRAHLTASTRLVLFQRLEVTADGISLSSSFGEGVLVLVAEGRLALGLSLPWWHTTSFVAKDDERNLTSAAQCCTYTATASGSLHSAVWRAQ